MLRRAPSRSFTTEMSRKDNVLMYSKVFLVVMDRLPRACTPVLAGIPLLPPAPEPECRNAIHDGGIV